MCDTVQISAVRTNPYLDTLPLQHHRVSPELAALDENRLSIACLIGFPSLRFFGVVLMSEQYD